MRDVGGKGLDIVDPLAERLAHVGNRAREQADLVSPRRQPRHPNLAGSAEPDAVRGKGDPAERPDDGPGEEQRQQHRYQDRDPHRDRQPGALAAHRPGEAALVGRDEQGSAVDRRGRREDRSQVRRGADHVGDFVGSLGLPGFGPSGDDIRCRLYEIGRIFGADQRIEAAIERARGIFHPALGSRVAQSVCGAGQGPAVGDQSAIGAIKADPASGRFADRGDCPGALLWRDRAGDDGADLGLSHRPLDPLLAQLVAEGIEIDDSQREDQHREDVDGENSPGERPPGGPRPRRAPPAPPLIDRRSGNRRHKASRWNRRPGRPPGICGGFA